MSWATFLSVWFAAMVVAAGLAFILETLKKHTPCKNKKK